MPSTVSAKIKTYLESTYNKNDVLSLIFLMLACLTKSVANILDLRGGVGGKPDYFVKLDLEIAVYHKTFKRVLYQKANWPAHTLIFGVTN